MAESITKHEAIRFSYPLDLASCTGMECTHLRIIIRMDDAFTLNCRPTVPVGCEEQVDIKSLSSVFIFKLCHFKAFDDYVTLHNLQIIVICQ